MKIMQISNSYTKPQNQTAFGDRDDWGDCNLDPWVVERRELGKEYLAKKKELDLKLDNDEISLFKYSCDISNLKKWLKNGEKAIAEKWHKMCINYEPPKKNFIQKLFKLK